MAFNVDEVEALLIAAAQGGAAVTYSQMLGALGHRFTRPLMRQLCVVLDAVDSRARGCGDPELAVLVVRQSDALPGQGWWLGERGYSGAFEGAAARAYVGRAQARAFARWCKSNVDAHDEIKL